MARNLVQSRPMASQSEQKPTVFIVDDDQAMRSSLKWLIESIGVQVESFASADAFLADYQPGCPGCLVLDVRMPVITGLELQSQLESHDIRLPEIILTGHGDVGMAVQAMKASSFASTCPRGTTIRSGSQANASGS